MRHGFKTYAWLLLFTVFFVGCASAGGPHYAEHDLRKTGKIEMPAEYQQEEENLEAMNATLEEKTEGDERVVATSVALCQIMDQLDINLVGRPITHLGHLPARYEQTKAIGMPMNPDMEVIYSLKPTVVYSPDSLKEWLEEGFKKHQLPISFVNLKSVDALYKAIEEIGARFHKEEKAQALLDDYHQFLASYGEKKPSKPLKVLILMGLPGSYVVATPVSYVGSLVAMSGAENVFDGSSGQEFLNVSTEEMLNKDPDVILRTVHAMPDVVMEMFRKEFKENPIWSHFRAVKENKVFDLTPEYFGMSALLNYKEGLQELQTLYEQLGANE